jgi:hypothetical protein
MRSVTYKPIKPCVVMLSVVAPSISFHIIKECTIEKYSIRINHLVFAAASRWQHGYQKCLRNFYFVKNHKIVDNTATTESR